MKVLLLAAAALALWAVGSAEASPYGGMTLSWEEENGDNKLLRFKVQVLLRADDFGVDGSNVGDTMVAWDALELHFGDGTSETSDGHLMRVTDYDADTDFFLATLLGLDGTEGITHFYPAPWQQNGDPWPATLEAVSRRTAADDHVNNPGSVATVVAPVSLGDILPEASIVPPEPRVVRCPVAATCTFLMSGTTATGGPSQVFYPDPDDADGGAGTFVQPGPPHSSEAPAVTAYGGVKWNTTGATSGGYYSMQLGYAYDNTSLYYRTATDFMIYIDPTLPPPPVEPPPPVMGQVEVAFITPPSPCGQSFLIAAGDELHLSLKAATDTAGHAATIHNPQVPALTFTDYGSGSPTTATAVWRPTSASQRLVSFTASTPGDDQTYGDQAYCIIQMEAVEMHSRPFARASGTDEEGHRVLLLDRSTIPPGAEVLRRDWEVSGLDVSGEEVVIRLPQGEHVVCLLVEVVLQEAVLSDRTCTDVVIAAGPADEDLDGAPDDADNCPLTPNRDQADLDSDGTGDACEAGAGRRALVHDVPPSADPCAGVAPDDMDLDGRPDACDLDLDGDLVPNDVDNCPMEANPTQSDRDNDKIGDLCDSAGQTAPARSEPLRRHIDAVPLSDTKPFVQSFPMWLVGGALAVFILGSLFFAARRAGE